MRGKEGRERGRWRWGMHRLWGYALLQDRLSRGTSRASSFLPSQGELGFFPFPLPNPLPSRRCARRIIALFSSLFLGPLPSPPDQMGSFPIPVILASQRTLVLPSSGL